MTVFTATVFTATVDVQAPVPASWDAMVDWPSHGRWVAPTTVTVLTPAGRLIGAVDRWAFSRGLKVMAAQVRAAQVRAGSGGTAGG